MGHPCLLKLYSLSSVKQQGGNAEPYLTIESPDSKITSAVWGPVDETIITGHENGVIKKWDAKTGEMLQKVKHHTQNINDLQYNKDMTTIMSASKGNAARGPRGWPGCHECDHHSRQCRQIRGHFLPPDFHGRNRQSQGPLRAHQHAGVPPQRQGVHEWW